MSIARVVSEYLTAEHVPFTTVQHGTAFTAQEKAAAAHVKGRDWVKTVVCIADGEPILAAVPADYVVDAQRLRGLAGAHELRVAREEEFAPLYPGCEPGAVPPLGPLFHQRLFVDSHLAQETVVVFDGGSHTDAVRMRYADFQAVAHPVVGTFAGVPRH